MAINLKFAIKQIHFRRMTKSVTIPLVFLAAAFVLSAAHDPAGIQQLLQQLGLPPEMAPVLEEALNEYQEKQKTAASTITPPTTVTSPPSTVSPPSNSNCPPKNETCLPTTTDGPVNQQLDKPISDGVFTFYGAGGRGACGLDIDQPKMSAAASGQLFKSDGKWVESCFADKRSLLDDPICKGMCVKIDYNGKTLTVPINNKCPECPPGHVDLSIDAFNYLEPKGGEVGKATGATITYLKCDGTESC